MEAEKQINVRFSSEELDTIKRHAERNHRKLGPTVKFLTLQKLREEKLLPQVKDEPKRP